jgi:hypothetical protein
MDDTPRNRDRDGWDYLEGRGPGGPKASNVVNLPVSPPVHVATSQVILHDAGIRPNVATSTGPASPERANHLFLRAARIALRKFLAGEYIGPEDARYLEALDEMRRQEPKP